MEVFLKLSSGFFRNLLTTRWSIEFTSAALYYSIDGKPKVTLNYLDLNSIQKREGLVSCKLLVGTTTSKQLLEFSGISSDDCDKFIQGAASYAAKAIAKEIDAERPSLQKASQAFNALKVGDFYLNQSRVAETRESLPDAVKFFEHSFFDPDLIPNDIITFADEYREFINPLSSSTLKRNADYVARKKTDYKSIFDTIENYPLTDEQRTAVVTEEDNILLVAAAGSGKSSTLVAKILYLLKEGQYKAHQIIAFAYNKDAQLELTSRIDALFPKFNWDGPRVSARTFHGFCFDVLAEVHETKPSIATIATASKTQQLNYFINLVQELQQTIPIFRANLLTYYSIFKHPQPRKGQINSIAEYNDYLQSLNGKGSRNPETNEWEVTLFAMNGMELKSLEELRIANWLFLNGIKFEYERQYDVNTANQHYRQYKPDFYYPDVDLWHEHFALDAHGKAPSFMKDYEQGVLWKRALHEEQGTTLIETHSAHFTDGSVFDRIDTLLNEANIPRRPPSNEEINAIIETVFNPTRDLELVMTFLKHFKTNNINLEELEAKASQFEDKLRARAFVKVFKEVFLAYQQLLKVAGEIDFEDLVHYACESIEAGKYSSHYEYILVDEFQDASQDRLRLIKALAAQRKHTKIFAVGDDWQSIYRFSGADLKVMTGFPKIFGFTKELKLTQTFRSFQQIVDIASTFIQKNPDQLKKSVTTLDSTEKDPVILIPYDDADPNKIIDNLLASIQKKAITNQSTLSVFILTRYQRQKPDNLPSLIKRYPNLTIEWKTVHASKGLESDYVILHHLNSGNFGFPSEIADDPLLDLVIPEHEQYPHAEERRLLYVAITRAKRAVFGTYHPDRPSPFVKELSEIEGVRVMDQRFSKTYKIGDVCPQCKLGTLEVKTSNDDIQLGCSAYPTCHFTSDVRCPDCQVGKIIMRKAHKTGRSFYACNRFPKCKHIFRI